MELRGYLELLRRRWWILILGPLACGLAAFGFARASTPIYRATTTLLVNQTQVAGVPQYNDILTSERLTNTYAELVERRPILTETRRRLGLSVTEDALGGKVNVSTVRNTQLLKVSAEDPDPQLAAQIANTLSQAFIEDNAGSLARPGTVSIAEQAAVPGGPVRPNTMLNTILGGMLGLMVAGAIVLFQEYLDDTVKDPEGVEALAGLSTLGVISRFSRENRARSSDGVLMPSSDSAEAYRQLRTNIHFARLANELKTILVTSCNPREGKSTTVANLAVVLAQAGQQVIAVDSDLRRPSLHNQFNLTNSFGLTGLLLSEIDDPKQGLVNTNVKNLRILPSGPLPPNPSELLTSPSMEALMKALEAEADYVLFDSPPILAVTDASILAGRASGTILVVEMSKTRSEALRRAQAALITANARTLGVVINKAKRGRHGYYYYGYYHASAQQEPDDQEQTSSRRRRISGQPRSS